VVRGPWSVVRGLRSIVAVASCLETSRRTLWREEVINRGLNVLLTLTTDHGPLTTDHGPLTTDHGRQGNKMYGNLQQLIVYSDTVCTRYRLDPVVRGGRRPNEWFSSAVPKPRKRTSFNLNRRPR
jgi:hypothetical protein